MMRLKVRKLLKKFQGGRGQRGQFLRNRLGRIFVGGFSYCGAPQYFEQFFFSWCQKRIIINIKNLILTNWYCVLAFFLGAQTGQVPVTPCPLSEYLLFFPTSSVGIFVIFPHVLYNINTFLRGKTSFLPKMNNSNFFRSVFGIYCTIFGIIKLAEYECTKGYLFHLRLKPSFYRISIFPTFSEAFFVFFAQF